LKRTIQAKVISIEDQQGENPRVVLQCPAGETIEPKAKVVARCMFPDQETKVWAADCIKVLGKGRPGVKVGDTVEVQVILGT